MGELAEAVAASKPDGFTPAIVSQTEDHLYAEFQVRGGEGRGGEERGAGWRGAGQRVRGLHLSKGLSAVHPWDALTSLRPCPAPTASTPPPWPHARQSPTFGFIDDVEFYFPADRPGQVEYRSASRIGESDGDANRKRIKALRVELQKKGWRSIGY